MFFYNLLKKCIILNVEEIKRVNLASPGDTMETLFENIHPSNIEWPNEDEELDQDAIRLIMSLLEMDPMARLGARGTRIDYSRL